jgi:hypothetical protein
MAAVVDGKPEPDGEPSGARVVANLVRELAFEDDVETPLGRAARVRARVAVGDGLEMGVAIELGSDWPGISIAVELRNTGARARDVAVLEPFLWEPGAGARLALPGDAAALRFLALGHQSWSAARWLRLGERPRPPRRLVRRVYASPFAPRARRGRFVSESATALGQPERTGLSLGFTSHSRFLSWIELANEPGRVHGLLARCATDGDSLAPGGALASERLWLGLSAPILKARKFFLVEGVKMALKLFKHFSLASAGDRDGPESAFQIGVQFVANVVAHAVMVLAGLTLRRARLSDDERAAWHRLPRRRPSVGKFQVRVRP